MPKRRSAWAYRKLDFMDEKILLDPLFLRLAIMLMTAIAGINAFFIRGLVSKIDKADRSLSKYEEQIKQMSEKIESFSSFVRDISDLKSEIAVLKYAQKIKEKSYGSDL